jgi:hypothetical protein
MRGMNPKLFRAIDSKFTSLDDCGDYYGLEIPGKVKNFKYTVDEINEFVRKSYAEQKSSSYLISKGSEDERSLCGIAKRIYGTWTGALRANGIEPTRIRREFNSKDDVAKAYKEDIDKGVRKSSIQYFKQYFDTVEDIERYLGIYEEPTAYELYDKDVLDTLVYEIYSNEAEKVTVEILNNYDQNIVYSIRHHYNSILSYFSQLDVDFYAKPYVPFRWDAENTKRQLMRWIREGKPVNYTSVAYKHSGILDASRRFYGSYEGLFGACGLNYDEYRTDTNLASYYGGELEDVFADILSDLRIEYKRHLPINGCHPDFVSGKTWYDAKLSEWTISLADCQTVRKYEPHCDDLVIVFLRGSRDTDRMLSTKTRLVNVFKFVSMLPDDKQRYYTAVLNEIEFKVNANELGSQSQTETA